MFDSLGEYDSTQAPELQVVEPAKLRPLAHLADRELLQMTVEVTKVPLRAAGYNPDAAAVRAFLGDTFKYLLDPDTYPTPSQLGTNDYMIQQFITVMDEVRQRIIESDE